ncbi:MAG TPA: MFS transporter [Pseudogracilibacillus sp.]|nr:MFS transporter [Pseudogracilibacillus sp.]
MTKQTQLRNLKLLLFFFHFTNTIIISFLPLYLNFKGLSGTEIGWVLAVGPLASIISQPFWGFLSDKYRTVKWVLIMTIVGMLIFSVLFFQMNHLIFILMFGALFYFFSSPVGALGDSLAQRQADSLAISFGSIRTWGSIGFALSSLIIGQLLDIYGVAFMRWPYLLFGTILLIIAFQIRDVKIADNEQTISLKDLKLLFSNKPFIYFLLIMMFITITHRANDSFIGLFITELGGSESLVGVGWFIALVSEALIFAFAYKWFKKDHALFFIILASILYTIRWIIFALSTSPMIILLGQVLHGLTFGIFYLSALDYITRLIPHALKSSGHLIFYSVFFGVSGIIGSLGGGLLIDHLSGNHLYFILSLLTLVGASLLIIYRIKNPIKNSQ